MMIIFLGGWSFRKQRLPTSQQKQQAAVIISGEASTASWSTCCSAAYSSISPSEGQVQQRHRKPLGLTGCDAAILHLTVFHLLVDIRLKLWQKPVQVQLLSFVFNL